MRMTAQRWWDAAMVTVSVLLALVVGVLTGPPSGSQLGMLAVVAVVLIAYFAWGRRYFNAHGSVPALLYAGVLLASLAVGIGFDPNYSFMQVVIFPTLWVISRSTRQAVILNVLAVVPVALGYALYFGPSGVPSGIGVGVLSVAFSLALGSWITSVERAGEERSRLLDELLAVQDQLAAANREAGIDSERGRLAREIHDTIAQSLTGLVMVAQRAHADLEQATDAASGASRSDDSHSPGPSEHLVRATADVELIESMARDALTEARGLVAAISPVRVESTLADALGRLAQRFERETGVVVRTDLAGLSSAGGSGAGASDAAASKSLSPELEVVLLRCAQEALANVRKHAQAQSATLVIARADGAMTLLVSDDGVGPAAWLSSARSRVDGSETGATAEASGFGLAGMADRLELVGGSVRLDAARPTGSALTVTIPLTAATASAPLEAPAAPAETASIDGIDPPNVDTCSLDEKEKETTA